MIRIYYYKNLFKLDQNRCQNQDFSNSDRTLVRIQDLQGKSGEFRRDREGWTV